MTAAGGGQGTIGFVVWPTHAGAINVRGEEPIFDVDYRRGQISWQVNATGALIGRATIEVPHGEWTHIIYTRDPYTPGYVSAQKLVHPLTLDSAGHIDLFNLTETDISPLAPDKVLHD